MKTYDVYLFDLDGTLTNTGPIWPGIFRDGLADFGITDITDRAIAPHTHSWNEMTKLGIREADMPAFIESAYQRANKRLPEAPFYEGVTDMLAVLKKAGKRLGIFTTMDRPILEPVIAHRKPHPAGIEAALQVLHATELKAVYAGDKDTDILCAHNRGIDSILSYPPDHKLMYNKAILMASNPTHVINHWHELTNSIS